MQEEVWLIDGDDASGWRRDTFSSRLAAIHAGDELWGGAAFWVGRRTDFNEWLDLTWFPTDAVLEALQYSDGYRPASSLAPLITMAEGEEFDRVCREQAKQLIRNSEGLASYSYMVEVDYVDRELKVQIEAPE